MPVVVLVGTLDTKALEYGFLRDRIREHGVEVLLVDAGVYEPQLEPDVSRHEVVRILQVRVSLLSMNQLNSRRV